MALALAPLAQAGTKNSETAAGDQIHWHARGSSATAVVARAQAKPQGQRAVLQWTTSKAAQKKAPPQLRPAILKINNEEDLAPAVDAATPAEPVAPATADPVPPEDNDLFRSASQPTEAKEPAATDSQPSEAKEPSSPPGELPIPEPSKPAAEPTPATPAEDLFKDDPIPKPPATELPTPSGDLGRGMATVPGGPGCKDYDKQCRDSIRELQSRDITTVVVGIVIEGTEGEDFPCDCKLGRDFEAPKYVRRNFAPTLFTWKASGTCHKPLYFEDVQLERYGHSWNPVVQPFVSAAHFFVSVPLLPYKMGLNPPNECMYTLGYYRPGNCAPYMFEPIPLSLRGALFEAAGATAFAFWFWPPN
ncbi:MAG: hypothetical protein WDZ48_08510 [Pirellulales bacterium]